MRDESRQPVALTVLNGQQAEAGRVPPLAEPAAVIGWAMTRFEGWRIAATTSFGMEGCALIDMLARTGRPLRIVYVDTGFFFEETYRLRDRMIERYPHLTFVDQGTTLTPAEQERQYGPALWSRDPDLCCQLRKVEPMRRVLERVDVWFTAIRRDQSPQRRHLQIAEWDWQFDLLKICPLLEWTRADVWRYVRSNDVPYNELHEQGYPTVGCTHCTRPVPGTRIDEYSRLGRWMDSVKTECGLHNGTGRSIKEES